MTAAMIVLAVLLAVVLLALGLFLFACRRSPVPDFTKPAVIAQWGREDQTEEILAGIALMQDAEDIFLPSHDGLSNLESVRNAFREAASKYGCIDILVNNAGVSESTPFTEYTEETFDKVMDLNVKGVFNATRAASECMIAKGQGVILSTSSMVSIYGQPSGFAYPASKFAVNGLTVSLARELGPKGIRVNAVAPGITLTDMMKAVPKEVIDPLIKQIPLRRLGQPEDIANAFVFLASDEASYITGVVLSVDGMART